MTKPLTLNEISDRLRGGKPPRHPAVEHILNEALARLNQLDPITQHEGVTALWHLALGIEWRFYASDDQTAFLGWVKHFLTHADKALKAGPPPTSGPITIYD